MDGLGYPRQPCPEAALSSVDMWKRSRCSLFPRGFPWSFDHSGFAELIFTFETNYEFLL